MMTKTERLSRPASGSLDGNSRPLGEAAVDAAKRFCMIRVPRRACLVGLGLAVGIILAAGSSAGAAQRPPNCSSGASSPSEFKILDNQTYALCAVASCLVFNEVAYCKCDVLTGDSISLSLKFDNQNVCTVNEEGVKNGYMVSTFSVSEAVSRKVTVVRQGRHVTTAKDFTAMARTSSLCKSTSWRKQGAECSPVFHLRTVGVTDALRGA
jgi:hypothetical protein